MLADESAFSHETMQSWAGEGSAELSQWISQRTSGGNCVVGVNIQKCGQPNFKAPPPFTSRARIPAVPTHCPLRQSGQVYAYTTDTCLIRLQDTGIPRAFLTRK